MTWAPDYATLDEAKSYVRIGGVDTLDDVMLALFITAASRAVDNYCGRQFGQVASDETRTYQAAYDAHLGCWVAQVDDLYEDDITVINGDAQIVTDVELGPANALQKGRVYERLMLTGLTGQSTPSWCWPQQPVQKTVPITVDSPSWGWAAVPTPVKAATLLQTARLASRRDSPFGIAGSPTDGSETRLLAALDPDLKTSLAAFRRNWWAA